MMHATAIYGDEWPDGRGFRTRSEGMEGARPSGTPNVATAEKYARLRRHMEEVGPMWPTDLGRYVRGLGASYHVTNTPTTLSGIWPDLCEDDNGRLGFTWQDWEAQPPANTTVTNG